MARTRRLRRRGGILAEKKVLFWLVGATGEGFIEPFYDGFDW